MHVTRRLGEGHFNRRWLARKRQRRANHVAWSDRAKEDECFADGHWQKMYDYYAGYVPKADRESLRALIDGD